MTLPPPWPSPSLRRPAFSQVFDKDKISIVLDHYTPCKDIKSAELCLKARNFAYKHNITNFFDVGQITFLSLLPSLPLFSDIFISYEERSAYN